MRPARTRLRSSGQSFNTLDIDGTTNLAITGPSKNTVDEFDSSDSLSALLDGGSVNTMTLLGTSCLTMGGSSGNTITSSGSTTVVVNGMSAEHA